MNTIDDLRSTLEREAEFDDVERHVRSTSVQARIRAVRRRRAGSVAVAAAVALVLAAGTVGLVRGAATPEPAEPTLDDVQVPQRIEMSGFPYELTDTQRAADDGTVTIEGADDSEGRVVTLVATGLGSGYATLWWGYYPVARVRGGEQLSRPVDAGPTELRVEFDDTPDSARAEVALYEPTGELAPGVASDGVVFRQRYGDRELVDAAFGHAGGDATVDVPDAVDDLDVSPYCHSATSDLWIHSEGIIGGVLCADVDTGNDPGAANQGYLQPQSGENTYTVYVTKGEDGPRATDVDVTFGVGLYRQTVAPTRVLGAEVLTVLELDGRTWRLADVLGASEGDKYEVDTSHGDVYIGAVYVGAVSGFLSWPGAPEGRWGGFTDNDQPEHPGAMYGPVLLAGDHTVQLHLEGPDAEGRVLVYRLE